MDLVKEEVSRMERLRLLAGVFEEKEKILAEISVLVMKYE